MGFAVDYYFAAARQRRNRTRVYETRKTELQAPIERVHPKSTQVVGEKLQFTGTSTQASNLMKMLKTNFTEIG